MTLVRWIQLDASEIRKLFGTTTVHEKPLAFRGPDGKHHVVLRGELDEEGEENLCWSLCLIEAGETVELARNHGVEELDGNMVEISWDGLFPGEWVDAYAAGFSDWIRISVTEILEKFGDNTVQFEQPQAWRHRSGEFYLVLVGDTDEETQEEEYAWGLVREQCGEYVEIAECHPDNGFGAEDLPSPAGVAAEEARAESSAARAADGPDSSVHASQADSDLEEEDEEALFDGWWEAPPFEWGARMVAAIEAGHVPGN